MNSNDYDLTFFWKGPLSQWHRCQFEDKEMIYNCAEQYMMYQKARLFKDRYAMTEIMKAEHPRIQKNLGRLIENFNQSTWDEMKVEIVTRGNMLKFTQNLPLLGALFGTSRTLAEASPYDAIWGIGLSAEDPKALDVENWPGLNLLGKILTRVREELLQMPEFDNIKKTRNNLKGEFLKEIKYE